MDRISGDGYAVVDGKRRWTNGSPGPIFVEATQGHENWFNGIQEEIVRIIEAAGLTPSDADWDQLKTALYALLGRLAAANVWTAANEFQSDVTVSGTGNVSLENDGGLYVQKNTLMDGQLSVGDDANFSVSHKVTAGPITSPTTLRAWGTVTVSSGTVTISSSENVSGVTVSGNDLVVSFTTPIANANYPVTVDQLISSGATANVSAGAHSRTVGGFKITAFDTSNAVLNPASAAFTVMFHVAGTP